MGKKFHTFVESVKTIFAILGCLLSIAVTVLFIYFLITSKDVTTITDCDISNIKIINKAYELAVKIEKSTFNLSFLGVLALIIDIIFSKSMYYFFQKLPLGYFEELEEEGLVPAKRISNISPALIIGLYISIHVISSLYAPDIYEFAKKWLLPIMTVLAIIALIAVIVETVINGGLWGLIIKAPALAIENMGLSVIFGTLGTLALLLVIILIIISIGSRIYLISALSD